MIKLKPVSSKSRVTLHDRDARVRGTVPSKDVIKDEIDALNERMAELQKIFHADGRRALMIVLQGRDAAGKDGAIRNVFESVDPQGCEVTSFKAPTELELSHDFLWRVHAQVPAHGMIGVFNRSHYEDVLVVRVRKLVPKQVWAARYEQINNFERMLTQNGVIILKFFLHISQNEQRDRLRDRLSDPEKNWKFRAGDLDDRAKWDAYTVAYVDAIRRCSTPWAPWYVVPADSKSMRNLLMSQVVVDTLSGLKLRYPRASKEVLSLKID